MMWKVWWKSFEVLGCIKEIIQNWKRGFFRTWKKKIHCLWKTKCCSEPQFKRAIGKLKYVHKWQVWLIKRPNWSYIFTLINNMSFCELTKINWQKSIFIYFRGMLSYMASFITSTYLRPFDRQYLPDFSGRRIDYIEFPKIIMSETFSPLWIIS